MVLYIYRLIDKLRFDTCNSRNYRKTVSKFKMPLGTAPHEEDQKQALINMVSLIQRMQFGTRNQALKPFQKSMIISSKSILSLFYELRAEGWRSLPTARLNQDPIENLFRSDVKGMIFDFHLNYLDNTQLH